jgi:hypothetical protein
VNPAYPEFRRGLDEVLRRRDPAALRAYLIAQGQWTVETGTDPERAMWMMIATSPALRDLHGEAGRWLADHGYAEEARVLGRQAQGSQPPGRRGPDAPSRRGASQSRRPRGSHPTPEKDRR